MPGLTHRRGLLLMLLTTLLWSTAGVVSRHLEAARSFEVTFWRSLFCAVALGLILLAQRGPRGLAQSLRRGGALLWWSGLCWTVMFTAFMLALTLTTVANVLITMAVVPLFTALIARFVLHQRLPLRTWVAIVLAGVGIATMFGSQLDAQGSSWLGTLVALAVPIGGATMWTLAQHNAQRPAAVGSGSQPQPGGSTDLMPAVLIGAVGSALLTVVPAQPLSATPHDLLLLGGLGVFQLAVPCLLAVVAGRVLQAPEAALLGLLEVIFGVSWAWLGSAEKPTVAVLAGGALVITALAANEVLALVGRSGGAPDGGAIGSAHRRDKGNGASATA